MTKPDILITGTYPKWDMGPMEESFTLHTIEPGAPSSSLPRDVAEKITGMAMKGHAHVGPDYLDALPNLGMIANYGVGYDTIDVEAASDRGIPVTNTPDVLSGDVADLAAGMLLARARNMVAADAWVRSGNWAAKGDFPLQKRVWGKRVGIVGLGRIGREIADRLAAFKMEISYSSRAAKETPGWTHYTDPAAMAAKVDYLVIALAGGPETAGLVSSKVINALGPDGILLNISRGSTVDEEALLKALETGAIAGAALDVFNNEPDIDQRFLALENVVLQPHQASATQDTREAMGALQRENLAAYYAGKPLITPVNEAGKTFGK